MQSDQTVFFFRCVLHHLKDKPRILVTHQMQFLDMADRILILKQVMYTRAGIPWQCWA